MGVPHPRRWRGGGEVVAAGSISEISPRYFRRLVETLLLGEGRPAEDGCCRMVIR